ncbi:MAG TPA: hypothetical protein VE641_14020, partial [Chthoniobacterales bacterium]|nr:hypothetical protein [Chthoniobacterales bacterium]
FQAPANGRPENRALGSGDCPIRHTILNGQLTSPKGNRGPELDAQSLFEALGWRTYVGLVIAQSSVLYYSDGAALRLKGTIAATEVAAQLCFFQLR